MSSYEKCPDLSGFKPLTNDSYKSWIQNPSNMDFDIDIVLMNNPLSNVFGMTLEEIRKQGITPNLMRLPCLETTDLSPITQEERDAYNKEQQEKKKQFLEYLNCF